MLGLFEYKLDGNGDAFGLDIKMDSVSAKALARVIVTSTGQMY